MALETKGLFITLIEDVRKQSKRFPEMTELDVIEKFFSEKHEVAIRLNRFHEEVMAGGLSQWRKNGFMKEDFEIIFEYVEKGYAQEIKGFDDLLSLFTSIRDLGSPEKFSYSEWVKEECTQCEGTGGTYVSGKCTVCDGKGRIPEEVTIVGEGEEQYSNVLNMFNETYQTLNEKERIHSFEEFINRLDEEEVDIEKAVNVHTKSNQKFKPDCKLIGEDGNVFNLMAIVYRTLKKEGMTDKGEEMQERVWACNSYGEALNIFSDYVDIC
ncbi:hypothetical protein CVD28_01355 [Bacillus sp. M6-12]|uniref:hypothetical protein n=1 Tax=Bacillus sp. M6-12 TaxID=2054166 RepID=UPI000C759B03|nr:hypothetical protein [Bacillus sp. M6-12]PLS19081.1 hypothetical protein CVD28_01355 [Bacillus sp. M6-12]